MLHMHNFCNVFISTTNCSKPCAPKLEECRTKLATSPHSHGFGSSRVAETSVKATRSITKQICANTENASPTETGIYATFVRSWQAESHPGSHTTIVLYTVPHIALGIDMLRLKGGLSTLPFFPHLNSQLLTFLGRY